MDSETKDIVVATNEDAAKVLDTKARELVMAQLLKIIADPKQINSVTVGVKFSDGNANFAGSGSHFGMLELIDAHTVDVAVSLMERLAMDGLNDTREFVEALSRIEGVLMYGRVPQQAVIGRLIQGAKNTNGKLSVATMDAAKIEALGCGNPDCDECGGDGSKLSDSSDKQQEAPPHNKRVLH